MESDDDIQFDESDVEPEITDYQILTPSTVESEMKEVIGEVQNILEVTPGVSRILLHKYKWNKNQLMDKFYESPDTEAFLIESQVIPKKELGKIQDSNEAPSIEDECSICCDVTTLSGLACGHKHCNLCWQTYIQEKIKDGQSEIQCMASNCELLMVDEKITDYITDLEEIEKYHKLIVKNYVDTNSLLCWCPGIECENAIKVRFNEPRLVICSCATQFCFSCGNNPHKPAICRLVKLWTKKADEMKNRHHSGEGYGADRETFTWLMSNTKDCPQCMVSIEKNGGCNYMQCRNAKCRFQFCWVCMKAWSVHSDAWYQCNSYDEAADQNREKSRASFHRFLFYYTRFVAHERSLGLEEKLRTTVRDKMLQMEVLSMRWIEVQYLQKAVDTLSECRRTMMYTYIFAYYLKRDNNSMIFEANQKDLEMATEQLSGFLERDLEQQDLDSLRQNVLDKCRYVEHRRKVLLDHCEEGEEEDIWFYNE